MNGDARRAGGDADVDRVDDARHRAAARVAQRRHLVDVDGRSWRCTAMSRCCSAIQSQPMIAPVTTSDDLLRPGADLVPGPVPRSSRAAAARCPNSAPAAGPVRRARASTRSIAAAIAGTICEIDLLPDAHVQQHLRIGHQVARPGRRASRPCQPSVRSTFSAVHKPSPVNRYSEKMMWPDCSPPSDEIRA